MRNSKIIADSKIAFSFSVNFFDAETGYGVGECGGEGWAHARPRWTGPSPTLQRVRVECDGEGQGRVVRCETRYF